MIVSEHLYPQTIHEFFQQMRYQLESDGCVARPHGLNQMEIWETDLTEHYFVTLVTQPELHFEVMQIVT